MAAQIVASRAVLSSKESVSLLVSLNDIFTCLLGLSADTPIKVALCNGYWQN
jgi:hypothetical protein